MFLLHFGIMAEIGEAFLSVFIEISEPDLRLTAPVRDKSQLPAHGRPCGLEVCRGVFTEVDKGLIIEYRADDDFKIRGIGFVGDEIPIRRPGGSGIIFHRVRQTGEFTALEIQQVKIPWS